MTDAPAIPADVAAMIGGPQAINAAEAAGISPPPMPAMFAHSARTMPAVAEPAVPVVPALPAAPSPVAPQTVVSMPEPLAPVSARIVGGPTRSRLIPLTYPVAFAGKVHTAIQVRRPSSAEVGAFFELIADGEDKVRYPLFLDADGLPIPEDVWAAMDDEDEERVAEAGLDFLPPRLQRLRAALQPASAPTGGGNTEQTSSK